jgi:hypothetical protein
MSAINTTAVLEHTCRGLSLEGRTVLRGDIYGNECAFASPTTLFLFLLFTFGRAHKTFKMKWKALLLGASFAHAALRFGCSTVSVQRLDPLVEPGANPSSHVHQVTLHAPFPPLS